MWAIAKQRGDSASADTHLRAAKLQPGPQAYWQIVGYCLIGQTESARGLLEPLRQLDGRLAGNAEGLLQKTEAR